MKSDSLQVGHFTFQWGSRTYVMGILNVTPDSFSGDGLMFPSPSGRGVRGEGDVYLRDFFFAVFFLATFFFAVTFAFFTAACFTSV